MKFDTLLAGSNRLNGRDTLFRMGIGQSRFGMQKNRLLAGAIVALLVIAAVVLLHRPLFWYRYFAIGTDIWTAQPVVFRPTDVVKGAEGGDLPFVDADSWAIAPRAIDAAINHASTRNTNAFIVLQNGRVEVERYWGSATRDTVYNGSAVSAVTAALLIGIAIDEGHIETVDDPIGHYLPAWKEDPRGAITIRQALQMTSGLQPIPYSGWPWSAGSAYLFGASFETSLLAREATDAPGKKWMFNPEDASLAGLVLEKATGKAYADYLSEKLWQPLGMAHSLVYVDRKNGHAMQSCCLISRPMDWAKLAQLILDNGRFNGERIVSASWIHKMTAPGRGANSFGFQIWLGDSYIDYSGATVFETGSFMVPASEPFAANDVMVLHSPGQHRVWIFPEYDLVVVRASTQPHPNWDETYLSNVLISGLSENRKPKSKPIPVAPMQVRDQTISSEESN